MDNIILTKVASAYTDNYQNYNIPIIDKDSLDISLEHVKEDILTTLLYLTYLVNLIGLKLILC